MLNQWDGSSGSFLDDFSVYILMEHFYKISMEASQCLNEHTDNEPLDVDACNNVESNVTIRNINRDMQIIETK
ncbi:hypothetical protein H5P36_19540 [Bacillus sp. APMAM]|nr:hypothetical protein [Bacillus sp. APMAM]RTZ54291.1 hypothetical protein EKO25_18995 [Bacillus sp. SAJ1]